MILTKGKVKDKEHLKLRCLEQVGAGFSGVRYPHSFAIDCMIAITKSFKGEKNPWF